MTARVIPLLTAASAVAPGTAIYQPGINGSYIYQVTGTFVGTVKLQGSLDNTTWVDLAEHTAEAGGKVDSWLYIRGNVTAYTSGNITLNAFATS
ncbi:MAG TPA: hypothetical protein PKH39_19570 [Woeseiaceae bacterium]|nr:hypothetical protein [Woeseiaceae bacterium]